MQRLIVTTTGAEQAVQWLALPLFAFSYVLIPIRSQANKFIGSVLSISLIT
ncbi:hypothetical protein MKY87_18890 [Paenibacillus sp. FSL R7-0198]|uniref:hypothetical protein n=1 Tax=unclassified Paenibacillus TaxID=185978 RepID=UPI0030CE4A73